MYAVLPSLGPSFEFDSESGRAENVGSFYFALGLSLINPVISFRKAHMDQVFDQAKVEVSATLKAWEPQRQYEKKLNNIMNKDKGTVI